MGMLDAAAAVLAKAGEPLHYATITQRAIAGGLVVTSGKTPEATMNAQLAVDIKHRGANSRFIRTAPGLYALRESGLPEFEGKPHPGRPASRMSFTDAAEHILMTSGSKQPLHYRDVWDRIKAAGLVDSEGRTPEATLYSQVLTEITRRQRRGETPRFVKHGRGFIGLTKWRATGLEFQIERHNADVHAALLKRVSRVSPEEFEALVERLLVAMGFEDTEVTRLSGDKGIDVRGTLVIGDVVRIRMAVQAKRWNSQNVRSDVVQQVRGSLGTHEHGLIVTTSNFSAGAYTEALRPDATPVALMNGKQFAALLVEHDIGVSKTSIDLLEIAEEVEDEGP